MLDAIRRTHAAFAFRAPEDVEQPWFIDKLSGNNRLRSADFSLSDCLAQANADATGFAAKSRDYWLYKA